ncbi:hypothetical protein O9G_001813 [Rozella allomycis CSF55]|uniref:Uncharacterized protein n=1 Tax=Rozella allomycis (strain CSF55) TaxID=988480 RepID=A0A075AWM3_ROZAC|nr:hypothetical protein O9G_001813 [Rozella allomycis CSF55]|eukprot:EPZ34557.1 hypothetical protein O9G_001813 [Rozella allomycis CSF55]
MLAQNGKGLGIPSKANVIAASLSVNMMVCDDPNFGQICFKLFINHVNVCESPKDIKAAATV